MITINDVKTGMTVEYQGNLYMILDFQHVKSANSMAFIRTKMKNLRTGATTETAFNNGTKMEKAFIERKTMQYIYDDGTHMVFMDTETYVQTELSSENLQNERNFLVEGATVTMLDYQGEIIGVQLPEKVTLEIIDAAPNVKGNTASNATKDATLQTGYHIQVPLFINAGEQIVVTTADGKYYSRA